MSSMQNRRQSKPRDDIAAREKSMAVLLQRSTLSHTASQATRQLLKEQGEYPC